MLVQISSLITGGVLKIRHGQHFNAIRSSVAVTSSGSSVVQTSPVVCEGERDTPTASVAECQITLPKGTHLPASVWYVDLLHDRDQKRTKLTY